MSLHRDRTTVCIPRPSWVKNTNKRQERLPVSKVLYGMDGVATSFTARVAAKCRARPPHQPAGAVRGLAGTYCHSPPTHFDSALLPITSCKQRYSSSTVPTYASHSVHKRQITSCSIHGGLYHSSEAGNTGTTLHWDRALDMISATTPVAPGRAWRVLLNNSTPRGGSSIHSWHQRFPFPLQSLEVHHMLRECADACGCVYKHTHGSKLRRCSCPLATIAHPWLR